MKPVFDSLESFFSSLAFRAETLGHRHSWRLGQGIQAPALLAHEVVLRVQALLGWNTIDRVLLTTIQAAAPVAAPMYPYPYGWMGNVSPIAQQLWEGRVGSADGFAIPITAISWRNDGFERMGSTSRFHFHSLKWIVDLIDAHEITGDGLYLQRAKELTAKWFSECLYTERKAHVWDDHGTALRALALCRLWATVRAEGIEDRKFTGELLAAIFRHAQKLSRPPFYRAEHNHGVTQAYALMAIGLVFNVHPKGKEWAELGRLRLEQQMTDNVSLEGIHREHSPYYHFYVFRQFYYAFLLANAFGISFSERFNDKLRAMLDCGTHLIKPNGKLAALGDTFRSAPLLVDEKDLEQWPLGSAAKMRRALGKGESGDEGSSRASSIYPGGGVAVLTSADGPDSETYLIFRLSTFPTSHIHRDVFSFELFAFGEDLVVDSGGPFAYGHPMRDQYFLTTRAHNTVVVDGKDQEVGEGKVLHWATSRDYDFLVAEHRNYPGVLHQRTVLFVKPTYLLILDKLSAADVHEYHQLFHLNPSLEVNVRGLAVSTEHIARGPTVRIVPLLAEGLGFRMHRGTDRSHQGWVCTGDQRKEANSVIEYSRRGNEAEFATLIVPERPGKSVEVAAGMTGRLFEEEVVFEISLGGRRDHIIVSPDGAVTRE